MIYVAVLLGNSCSDESCTKIGAVVNYGLCACDYLESILDCYVMIQMDILHEFYTAPVIIMTVYKLVNYNDVKSSHAIENNQHKNQYRYYRFS